MSDDDYAHALKRLLQVTSSPRLGLGRMERLLSALGDPHRRLKTLHIAGTNGKGSVAAMLESMLRHSDLTTGMTTSPHLCMATERIQVNGAPVSKETFVGLEMRVHEAARMMADPPTFFERIIAMAFCAFDDAKVDIGVVEVGLGGRLDATNVIEPLGCVLTTVGLDHQQFLGDTIGAIAAEKAGILKRGVPAIVGDMDPVATAVIRERGQHVGAPMAFVGEDIRYTHSDAGTVVTNGERTISEPFALALAGTHQRQNAAAAVGLLDQLGLGDAKTRREGLEATLWPGRFEVFANDGVTFVLDGAHNPASAAALAGVLMQDARTAGKAVFALVGATDGHHPEEFVKALGRVHKGWATQARAPRSMPAVTVLDAMSTAGWHHASALPLETALATARAGAGGEGIVLVTGSLYLVGEVRALLLGLAEDPVLPLF